MKNILFVFTFLFSAMLFSQNLGSIHGTVTDQALSNEPMLFANVQLKGSNTSYQTNFHGNFEISNVKPGEHTLVISYPGYDTEELAVVVQENNVSKIETDLSPIQISFDNVVGMDTVSKEESRIPSDTEESSKR
ncbi:MAG: carboxypeptidase-like regulatory domain-containing protein [Maribacter sp.]|uniref:carboxypeptidase-like regulatory domain-containing protein n=1 Tax=Maribacter sp. TaxID=1897614 RepID=UPI003299B667